MAVVSSRAEIKRLLAESKFTLFVISGGADSEVAKAVHAAAEDVAERWQRVVWIQDLSLLNENEKETWLAMGGRYVVIARNTREPKRWGYASEFLLKSGKVRASALIAVIAEGDV